MKYKKTILVILSFLGLVIIFFVWVFSHIGPTSKQREKSKEFGNAYIKFIAEGKQQKVFSQITDQECESEARALVEQHTALFGNSEIKELEIDPFFNLHATDDLDGFFYRFKYKNPLEENWKEATASIQISYPFAGRKQHQISFCGEASWWFAPWNKESPWYREK